MAAFEITAEMNLKKTIAEVKEFAKAMAEFADALEQIEKKYADGIHKETVTEFADRCRECGAHYGKLLKQSEWQHDHEILKAYSDGASAVLDNVRAEIEHMIPCSKEALSIKLGVLEIIDKYKPEVGETE